MLHLTRGYALAMLNYIRQGDQARKKVSERSARLSTEEPVDYMRDYVMSTFSPDRHIMWISKLTWQH